MKKSRFSKGSFSSQSTNFSILSSVSGTSRRDLAYLYFFDLLLEWTWFTFQGSKGRIIQAFLLRNINKTSFESFSAVWTNFAKTKFFPGAARRVLLENVFAGAVGQPERVTGASVKRNWFFIFFLSGSSSIWILEGGARAARGADFLRRPKNCFSCSV